MKRDKLGIISECGFKLGKKIENPRDMLKDTLWELRIGDKPGLESVISDSYREANVEMPDVIAEMCSNLLSNKLKEKYWTAFYRGLIIGVTEDMDIEEMNRFFESVKRGRV